MIRGINTGADFGQAVGITVDGAPIGPSSSFQSGGASSLDLDPIDLERVEVLKGPQGTVYGANSLAGLVSYTLREPDLQAPTAILRAALSGTQHGGTSHSQRAAVSVPIVTDRLAVRVSGFHDRRAGFIDNRVTNTTDQDDWRSYGVQGSVLFPTTLTEYSAFGNLTYEFSPTFDVTGGVRVGRIEQVNRTLLGGSNADAYRLFFVVNGLGDGPPADTGAQKGSKTIATYLATARYHFSRDGMVFARFATGFRPGGPNFPVPGLAPVYDPDQTYNYELGIKTKFWDGRGSLDVTGYYLKWKDFLAFASAGGLNGLANAGDACVYGAEGSMTLRPVDDFSLTGTLAFSDSKITRVDPAAGIAAVGDTLPYNPLWSGSLSAEYRAPVDGRWQAAVRGTARFTGARNSSPQSSLGFPNYVLPAYSLFDLHAGLESDRIDIDLFVKNITDKRAQLAAFTQLGINQITVQQPRTIGAAVTFKYSVDCRAGAENDREPDIRPSRH